jgi:hypothetical protein
MSFLAQLMALDLMQLSIWILLGVFCRMLWKLYRSGRDFSELIIGDDGRMSWTKILGCTGGVVFTYGFLYLLHHDRLTEYYFNGYGLLCFGTAFAYKLQAMKNPLSPPQQNVQVSAPADANVTVSTGQST